MTQRFPSNNCPLVTNPFCFKGTFLSIRVRPTQSLEYTLDLDGVVLLTTYFEFLAFNSLDTWDTSSGYSIPAGSRWVEGKSCAGLSHVSFNYQYIKTAKVVVMVMVIV